MADELHLILPESNVAFFLSAGSVLAFQNGTFPYPHDWMLGLAIALIAVTLGLLWRHYRHLHEHRAQELERLVAERTRELEKTNERLRKAAIQDPLTGIANYRHYDSVLRLHWKLAQRSKLPVSLMMIDVDSFKAYNDHFGHPAGDLCLKKIAEEMDSCFRRPGDLVARYGGEEFVVVMLDTDRRSAWMLAERLRRAIEDLAIPHPASAASDVVTVSIGIGSAHPKPGDDLSELVREADDALYEAKALGRNRICKEVRSRPVSQRSSGPRPA